MTGTLKRGWEETQRQGEEAHVKPRWDGATRDPRNNLGDQALEKARKTPRPEPSEAGSAPAPWLWTARFQNCERIKFCWFKPSRLS